ncbi:MAG: PQQ-like beta-propeller repeat protein [Pirellulales bacterium]
MRTRCIILLLGLAAFPGRASAGPPATAELLKSLLSVGHEAAGNREAARAWSQLLQGGADQLPELLGALDGANPLAANWLRGAVDAIAERELARGGKLPVARLEQFALDRRHAPRARDVAYQWLSRTDRTAPERLMPGMLDDPSVELRRLAVASLLDEAKKLADSRENRDAALAVYRKALTAARDLDQVRLIAEALQKLGEKVDLARHFGFITTWKVIGPFDNAGGKGFRTAHPPESEIDLAKQYPGKNGPVRWIDHTTTNELGMVDLNQALGKHKEAVAYAAGEFVATRPMEVELRLGCVNANKLWLNGKLLDEHEVYHAGTQMDQYVVRAAFIAGTNHILVKVCQNELTESWADPWQFQLRVCDAVGTGVTADGPQPLRTEEGRQRAGRPRSGSAGASSSQDGSPAGDPETKRAGRPRSEASRSQDNWLQFRGSRSNSVAADQKPPVTWSEKENVAWKVDLPGRGPSSPIVVAGRVVVTCSSGFRQNQLHVLCFDAQSGRLRWQRQFWATARTVCHPFGAVAAPTPASDGESVFAFFSSNDLVCLDLDGNLRWLRGLSYDHPRAENDAGMASSPLLAGGTVVLQMENQEDSFATGLDSATGENCWLKERPKVATWTSPVAMASPSGPVVLLQSPSGLTAVDPATGRELWVHATRCDDIPSAVTSGETIYLPTNGLTALRCGTGRPPQVAWQESRLSLDNASAVVDQGRVYALNRAGVLACGDAKTGAILWRLRLKGIFWATPVLAGGHLYCINYDGLAQVVRVGAEGKLAGESQFGEAIQGSPAVANDALFIRSDAHLWKIATRTPTPDAPKLKTEN